MAKKITLFIIAIILAIQLVGLVTGPGENPPTVNNVAWDSSQTQDLFNRACADCHSNKTKWPWYSKVAPVSWMIMHNVDEGREEFNISNTDIGEADESAEMVEEGQMPPWEYLLLHPEAELTAAEQKQLVAGLVATFGREDSDEDDHDHEHEHEHGH